MNDSNASADKIRPLHHAPPPAEGHSFSLSLSLWLRFSLIAALPVLLLPSHAAAQTPTTVSVSVDKTVIPEGGSAFIFIRASTVTGSVTVRLDHDSQGSAAVMLSPSSVSLMQDESTLISVSVGEDRERQEKNSTFSVTFSSDPQGAVFSSPVLTFTIPPNDLDVKLDSMGPFKFEKDAATLTLTFTTDGLQDKKTFAVSSPDTRVAVRTGLITTGQDSFDVVLGLTEGAELERRETIELEISHLDALKPSARDSAQISAGGAYTCGIRVDNTVACWGSNSDGQASPLKGEFLAVGAGGTHACGILMDDSTAACWGVNNAGQRDLTKGFRLDKSDVNVSRSKFLAVSAGGLNTCGILIDSTVACWGSNRPDPPEGVTEETKFIAVSVGRIHICGIKDNGTAACWGSNLTPGFMPDTRLEPTSALPDGSVAEETRFLAVSAGSRHTCGIIIDGTAACWGYDGSLPGFSIPPDGRIDPTSSDQDVKENTRFLSVGAGLSHSCGIRIDETPACWGSDSSNQSSPTSSTDPDQGGPVDESDRFLAVSVGDDHNCAIRIDGTTACWGRQDNNRSIPPDDFRARIIPDTFYLLEKQDMNVPLEIRSAVRLRIRVFLEGALR